MFATLMRVPAEMPFRLVGSRNYVQGSQMVARAASAFDPGSFTLRQCAFRRLTGLVPQLVELTPTAPLPTGAVGEATFALPTDVRRFAFTETKAVPPRMPEQSAWAVEAVGPTSRLEGRFAFCGASDFEALIEIAVRVLKDLHERFDDAATDIWFTGCRQSSLSTPPSGDGTIAVRPLRTLSRGATHQTFSSVAIAFSEGSFQEAVVGFALQSERFTYGA